MDGGDGPVPANGPVHLGPGAAMGPEEFERLFDETNNWGRWGRDDELGTLHFIDEAAVIAACRLARDGVRVNLGRPLDTVPGVDNAKPALHYMSNLCDRGAGEPTANMDFIGVDFHGKATTHLDALSHIAYRGMLYNGRRSADEVNSTGAGFGAVTALSKGIVGRGVLLDAATARDVQWVEPPSAFDSRDLQQVAGVLGVKVRRGDIVMLRSGAPRRRREKGAWDLDVASVGLLPDAVGWLAAHEIAVLGGDGDSDARPSRVEGVTSPVHVLAITGLGMPLLDNLDLEELSQICERTGRYEFLTIIAPLVVPGGTGSPVNPIAVL